MQAGKITRWLEQKMNQDAVQIRMQRKSAF